MPEVLLSARGNARIAIGADIGSAYLLGAVTAFTFNNPVTSAPIDSLILGTIITAFIASVDPISRIVGKRLAHHLEGSGHLEWVNHVLDMTSPKSHAWQNLLKDPPSRTSYVVGRSRRAFWQVYLSKERARFTSGVLLLITLGVFVLDMVTGSFAPARIFLALAGLLAVFVLGWSLRRRVGTIVPGFCWTVCVYGMVQEFYEKTDQIDQLLDRVRGLLIDEEWEEARQRLTFFAPY